MGRLPGSVCTVLRKWDRVDTSTLCGEKSRPPGTKGTNATKGQKPVAGWLEKTKRFEYLRIAGSVSYAMQGKSRYQSAKKTYQQWRGQKNTQRVQSYLGGKFLRMYLDGKVDPEVVEEAGAEIADSQEFKSLQAATEKYVQSKANRFIQNQFKENNLKYYSEKYLKARKNAKGGIAFKHTLNTVIGGITKVEVGKAEFLSKTKSGKRFDVEYEIEVIFYDDYDFENKRYGYYDTFRKKAARLLIASDFDAFEELVFGHAKEAMFDASKAKLDDASVFASFMYALEKKGWTPGKLSWHVSVAMRGMITVRK